MRTTLAGHDGGNDPDWWKILGGILAVGTIYRIAKRGRLNPTDAAQLLSAILFFLR